MQFQMQSKNESWCEWEKSGKFRHPIERCQTSHGSKNKEEPLRIGKLL